MPEATPVLTKKILLLDENLHLVYSLRPHLSLQSYTIQRVATAPEALALLHQEPVDLLVTNIRSSRANHDLSLLTEIRTREPNLPMILMAPEELEPLAQQLGASAYFRQPFSLLKLVETVREVLEGRRPSLQENPDRRPLDSVEESMVSPPPAEGWMEILREQLGASERPSPVQVQNEEQPAAPLETPTRAETVPEETSPPLEEISVPSIPTPRPASKKEAPRPPRADKPQVPTLSLARLEVVSQVLSRLRSDIGARCILLADILGNPITAVGVVNQGLNTTTLLSLLAGSYATILEMSRQMGEERIFNLNYHEGERLDIYSSNLGGDYLIAILIERKARSASGRALGPSPMGMVWLYAKRALLELMSILKQPEVEASPATLDKEFSASLRRELDSLFAGEAQTPSSLKREVPIATSRSPETPSRKEPEDRSGEEAPSSLSFQEARERGLIPRDLLAELDPSDPGASKEKTNAS